MFLLILQPEKDEEDFGTFDIPVFTEEFLDHNKSKLFQFCLYCNEMLIIMKKNCDLLMYKPVYVCV